MTKHREKEIYRTTLVGTAVNALLIVVKFVAGFVGQASPCSPTPCTRSATSSPTS